MCIILKSLLTTQLACARASSASETQKERTLRAGAIREDFLEVEK